MDAAQDWSAFEPIDVPTKGGIAIPNSEGLQDQILHEARTEENRVRFQRGERLLSQDEFVAALVRDVEEAPQQSAEGLFDPKLERLDAILWPAVDIWNAANAAVEALALMNARSGDGLLMIMFVLTNRERLAHGLPRVSLEEYQGFCHRTLMQRQLALRLPSPSSQSN